MVFFTCNHCGESLKKPSVEKHYQWKSCRGAVPFLTCVDCLKDFKGDEFKEHTKCISEEEKYSAKGFVAKPNKNKGAQKQESWTETLQNLLNKPGIDHQVKGILERIAAQTNVPRKKPKFINFVKSSMKISVDNANKVWNIVEEALEEFKQIAEANRQKRDAEKKAQETAVVESNAENGQKTKKKKKKKNDTNEETVDAEATEPNVKNGTVDGSAKKKKKKFKNGMNDSEMQDVTTETDEGKTIENGKSRKRALNNGTDDGVAKKKKKKSNGTNDSGIQDETMIEDNNEQDSTIVSDGKFNWQSTITSILSKKAGPMAIDKLKGKVVRKYATQTSREVTTGVEKKFLKKLKAIPNVEITNEFVKLAK